MVLSFPELAFAVLVHDLAELFQAEEDDQGVGTEARESGLAETTVSACHFTITGVGNSSPRSLGSTS